MRSTYTLRELVTEVRSDLAACSARGPLGRIAALLWDPAVKLLVTYRLSRYLAHTRRLRWLIGPLRWRMFLGGGNDISPTAILGRRIRFAHPSGVVIGAHVVVEDDVTLFQQVTLGSHGREGADKAYPVIGRGATIYAGAVVVGDVRVGANATVGANAVVNRNVPDGAVVAGVPARVIRVATADLAGAASHQGQHQPVRRAVAGWVQMGQWEG